MQIGRFFSLGQGRVGQYLSSRVLVVKTPFQPHSKGGEPGEFCCFGFDNFKQTQKFIQSLSDQSLNFKLRQSKMLKECSYEVVLLEQTDLARTLAYWDRHDRQRVNPALERSKPKRNSVDSAPAIAA